MSHICKLQKQKENRNRSPVRPAPVVNTEQFRKPSTPLAPRQPKSHKDPALLELKKTNVPEEPKVGPSPASEGPKISKSYKADSEVRQSKIRVDEVCVNKGY